MKRFLLLYGIVLTLCVATPVRAQNGERIKSIEIGYLTTKMNLSPDEAERFFPLFNQYWEEIRKIRIDAIGNKEPILETEKKIINVKLRYSNEFAKVLPSDKVNLFFRSEREFQGLVQREMIQRRQLRMEQKRPFIR
jgi:Skp family chaperone for outer membrane proteins